MTYWNCVKSLWFSDRNDELNTVHIVMKIVLYLISQTGYFKIYHKLSYNIGRIFTTNFTMSTDKPVHLKQFKDMTGTRKINFQCILYFRKFFWILLLHFAISAEGLRIPPPLFSVCHWPVGMYVISFFYICPFLT